jgi:hypothetical protein
MPGAPVAIFPIVQGGNPYSYPWALQCLMCAEHDLAMQKQRLSTKPFSDWTTSGPSMSTQCEEPCIPDEVRSLLSPCCHAQHRAQEQVCCLALWMSILLPTLENLEQQKLSSSHFRQSCPDQWPHHAQRQLLSCVPHMSATRHPPGVRTLGALPDKGLQRSPPPWQGQQSQARTWRGQGSAPHRWFIHSSRNQNLAARRSRGACRAPGLAPGRLQGLGFRAYQPLEAPAWNTVLPAPLTMLQVYPLLTCA